MDEHSLKILFFSLVGNLMRCTAFNSVMISSTDATKQSVNVGL